MFECLETPSLIMERYEVEGNLMVNRKDDLIDDRADLPYEQKMELLDKQRSGEWAKFQKKKLQARYALVFVLICTIVSEFLIDDLFPIGLAYSAFAVILAAVMLEMQSYSTRIGVINSRMEVLATEETSRNSTQSPPRERREKATWRTRRR